MMGEKEAMNKTVKQETMVTNRSSTVDQSEKYEHELGHRKRKSMTDHALNPEKRKSITATDLNEELERPKRLPEVGYKRNFVRDTISFTIGKATNISNQEAVSSPASEGERRDFEENHVAFSKRLRENRDPVKKEYSTHDGTNTTNICNTLVTKSGNGASLIGDRVGSKASENRHLNSSCKENEANLINSELERSKQAHPPITENKFEIVQLYCEYRMSVLVEKQREDIQKFNSCWEQKRVALEKKHNVASDCTCSEHRQPKRTIKPEILDKEFDNEMKQFKQEMEKSLKELEENQLASRNEESQKAAGWLRRAKLYPNEERVHTEIPLHGSQTGNQVGSSGASETAVGVDIDTANLETGRVDQIESNAPNVVKKSNHQASSFIMSNLSTIGEKCLVESSSLEGNNRNNQSNSEQERDSSSILSGKEQLKEPKYTRTVESISKAMKKFNQKCDTRMRRLIQKHEKEIQELNELWDQKWVIVEKSHEQNPAVNDSMQRFSGRIDNLDALNSGFANHMKEEYQCQKEILLKELEQKQWTEKYEECKKATHWIAILESELKLAMEDRANGEPSLVGTIKSDTVVANSVIPPVNSPPSGNSPKFCSPAQPVVLAISDLPLPHNQETQNKFSQPLSCNVSRDENGQSSQKLSLQVEVLSPEVESTIQQVVENQTDSHQTTELVHETPSGEWTNLTHYTDPPLYVAKDKSDFSHCGVEQIGGDLELSHPLLVSETPLRATPETSSSQDTVILPQVVELTAETLILPSNLETQNKFSQPLSGNVLGNENGQSCQKILLQVEILSPEVQSTVQQVVEYQTDLHQGTELVQETPPSGGRTNLPHYTDAPLNVAKDKSDFSHCGVEQIGRDLERLHPLLISKSPLEPTPETSSSQDIVVLPQVVELTADTFILPHNLEIKNKFSQPLSRTISGDENGQSCQKLSRQVEVLSPEVQSTVLPVVENETDSHQAIGLLHETPSGGRTNLTHYTDPPLYVAKDKSDFSHCCVERIGRDLERPHPLLVSESPLGPSPEKSSSQDTVILPQVVELTTETLILPRNLETQNKFSQPLSSNVLRNENGQSCRKISLQVEVLSPEVQSTVQQVVEYQTDLHQGTELVQETPPSGGWTNLPHYTDPPLNVAKDKSDFSHCGVEQIGRDMERLHPILGSESPLEPTPEKSSSQDIVNLPQVEELTAYTLILPHNLEPQNKFSQPLSCNDSKDENAQSCQKLSLQVEVLSTEVESTVQQVVGNQTDLHQATGLVHETPSSGQTNLPHYIDPPLYVAKDKSDFSHCCVERIGRDLERPHPLLVSESPLGPTPEKSSSRDAVILPQVGELTADTLILPHNLETQNKFSQPLSCNVLRDENAQSCQKLSLQVEVFSPEVTVQQVVENETDSHQTKDKSDFSHFDVEQIGRNLERPHPLLVSESPLGPTPEKSYSQDAVILPQAEELTADTLIHSILQSEPNLSSQDSNDYDQVTKEREYLKLRVECERAKEIEETSVKIKSNYESNWQYVETNYLLKKNEIETKQNKVILNDKLSEAFKFTHLNPSLLPTKRMRQVVNSSFLHLLHQLPPLDLVLKPSSIAEPPLSGIPSSSPQVSVRPPPPPSPSPPRLQVCHQSTGHFSTRPTTPLTITSLTPVIGNTTGVRSAVRAPAPHIRHFRPSAQTTLPETSRPPSTLRWIRYPQNIYPTSVAPPSWSTPPYLGPQSQHVQVNLARTSHSPPLCSSPPPPPSPHSLPVSTNQTSVFHRQQAETAGASTSTSSFTDLSALRFLVDMDNQ